jgi:hypothetical protein
VPVSIAATAPGFNPGPASAGTLVTAVSYCGAQLASEATGSWFRWPALTGCPRQAASSQAQTRSGGPGTAVVVAAALVSGAGQ